MIGIDFLKDPLNISWHNNGEIVMHPRRGIRRRQYTFLMYLLWYDYCFSEFLFDRMRIEFYSPRVLQGKCKDLIAHTRQI